MTDSTQPLAALTSLLQRVMKTHRGVLPGQFDKPLTVEEIFKERSSPADDVVNKCGGVVKENYFFCENDYSFEQSPPKSLHETGRQFSRKKFISEADLQLIFSLLRKAIDTVYTENSAKIISISLEIDKIIELIKPMALFDMRIATYMIVLISNLATNKESWQQVNIPLAWDFIKSIIIQQYINKNYILQIIFLAISNMALLENFKLTRSDCQLLISPIYSGYTQPQFVETWVKMLCNITAQHPETHQVFIELGVVELLQRLIIYAGEEGKTALRGVQCLSNLATGFTNGHFPAL